MPKRFLGSRLVRLFALTCTMNLFACDASEPIAPHAPEASLIGSIGHGAIPQHGTLGLTLWRSRDDPKIMVGTLGSCVATVRLARLASLGQVSWLVTDWKLEAPSLQLVRLRLRGVLNDRTERFEGHGMGELLRPIPADADDAGGAQATPIDYSLIAALVATVTITGIRELGDSIKNHFNYLASEVSDNDGSDDDPKDAPTGEAARVGASNFNDLSAPVGEVGDASVELIPCTPGSPRAE
jgi:Flp pilus assembly pilin Flp